MSHLLHLLSFVATAALAWKSPAFVINETYAGFPSFVPRVQWGANWGYCGELSFISSGLLLGQYVSQYDARGAATDYMDQTENNSQLRLGYYNYHGSSKPGEDAHAGDLLRLNVERWDWTIVDTQKHLLWIKKHLVAGHSVTLTEYTAGGDSDIYDHIVTAVAVHSNHLLDFETFYPDDVITIEDHSGSLPTFKFGDFIVTRKSGRAGLMRANAESFVYNYATAITGVADSNGETFPVSISTDKVAEDPEIKGGSTVRPRASNFTLTVTVGGLTPDVLYNLYTYNDFNKVPGCNFNANAAQAFRVESIKILNGTSYEFKEQILSSDMRFYRVVEANSTTDGKPCPAVSELVIPTAKSSCSKLTISLTLGILFFLL
ncbi:hypothetical protein HDU79_004805 [Rhizoclosmatium sp. JEL0117]|nr:hypothetical protein HDU79_004805 [Rhizoclosmatium sp. JEL0117]